MKKILTVCRRILIGRVDGSKHWKQVFGIEAVFNRKISGRFAEVHIFPVGAVKVAAGRNDQAEAFSQRLQPDAFAVPRARMPRFKTYQTLRFKVSDCLR